MDFKLKFLNNLIQKYGYEEPKKGRMVNFLKNSQKSLYLLMIELRSIGKVFASKSVVFQRPRCWWQQQYNDEFTNALSSIHERQRERDRGQKGLLPTTSTKKFLSGRKEKKKRRENAGFPPRASQSLGGSFLVVVGRCC